MQPTVEQANFKKFAVENPKKSIVLEAVAGSGKTTTLLNTAKDMSGNTAIIAFNKAIAEELKRKLVKMGLGFPQFQAGTCHSYGFSAYKKLVQTPIVNSSKVFDIVEDYFENMKNIDEPLPFELKSMVRKAVSMAKQNGIGVEGHISIEDDENWDSIIEHYDINDSDKIENSEVINVSKKILRLSNNQMNIIDFDDMIYLPLLYRAKFYTFDNVMIDEAQDINWVRREMASRMKKPGGRIIAVGDRNQAIYGFSGADSDSLDLIRKKFNAVEMSLSVCFRCGTSIVDFSNRWNTKIKAKEGAATGVVENMLFEDFMKETLNSESVMLCRNTKPLVETAFKLIRQGIPVYVEGRDIGEGLKKLASRWKVTDINDLVDRLETWKDKEVEKLTLKKKEAKIAGIMDQFETMMVIIDRCRAKHLHKVSDVLYEIESIFQDSPNGKATHFTLSTIHRSKGREWKTVYWLDRVRTLPSKYAKQAWQIGQENNLCYVAATRAMERLVEVTGE